MQDIKAPTDIVSLATQVTFEGMKAFFSLFKKTNKPNPDDWKGWKALDAQIGAPVGTNCINWIINDGDSVTNEAANVQSYIQEFGTDDILVYSTWFNRTITPDDIKNKLIRAGFAEPVQEVITPDPVSTFFNNANKNGGILGSLGLPQNLVEPTVKTAGFNWKPLAIIALIASLFYASKNLFKGFGKKKAWLLLPFIAFGLNAQPISNNSTFNNQINNKVPYVGAKKSLNLGNYNLLSKRVNLNGATDSSLYTLNVNGFGRFVNAANNGAIYVGSSKINSNSTYLDFYNQTIDGFDDKITRISGGGDIYTYRGALISLHGNETPINQGDIFIEAGDVSGGQVRLSNNTILGNTNNATTYLNVGGDILLDNTGNEFRFRQYQVGPGYVDVIKFGSTGQPSFAYLATGTVYSNSGLLTNTNPSDSSLKDSIKSLTYGLNQILQLRPKTFYYRSDSTKSSLKYGFIAQDVLPIMPDVVRKLEPKKQDSKLGLETDAIYVTMVSAIQEQQVLIDDLKRRLLILESK